MLPPTTIARQIALCAAALCALPGGVRASPVPGLETLFFTPAERQNMTLRRIGQEQGQGGDGAPLVTTSRLTGLVRRARGKGTIWVNGNAIPEGSPIVGAIKGEGAVVDGRRLRVGEGIDTTTGARTDIVAPGTVTPGGKP